MPESEPHYTLAHDPIMFGKLIFSEKYFIPEDQIAATLGQK
jgi:hypothetical protein